MANLRDCYGSDVELLGLRAIWNRGNQFHISGASAVPQDTYSWVEDGSHIL